MRIDNVRLSDIAQSYGTPCYVYSQAALEANLNAYRRAFEKLGGDVYYSVKANSNLAVLALMARLGAGFDIVSGGELRRVMIAGGAPAKTVFSGVGKSKEEIRLALESGISCINLESEGEMLRVEEIAAQLGISAAMSFRVNPDIDADTHPHIATGLHDAKFGVSFEQARRLYSLAQQSEHLEVSGIAAHIGSQIVSLKPFIESLELILDLVETLAGDGVAIGRIDLGGGLGVRYRDEEPPSPANYSEAIGETLKRRGVQLPVSVEPGRSIAAQAGLLVCRVEYIKSSPTRNFAVVDAGMNDLARPALYDAWMDIVQASESDEAQRLYDIVGPVCETGDFLGKARSLRIAAGDLLAVRDAGAYGAVMASNYNTRPRPPEVLVHDGKAELIRERESLSDLTAKERIPSRLRT